MRACIGSQRIIDVVNVETQESQQMTMKSWTDYYDQSADKREKLLNVISLEFSHTALEKYVESPSIVSDYDLSSCHWIKSFFSGTRNRLGIKCLAEILARDSSSISK